jgi:hypothetical protein
MANKNISARQWELNAITPLLGISNMGAATGYDITIPPGGYVTEITVDTLVAFDSATTATLTVTDGTTVFVNGVDIKTTGRETTTIAAAYYPSGGVIHVNLAQTGAGATVGTAVVVVSYLKLDRQTEVQH